MIPAQAPRSEAVGTASESRDQAADAVRRLLVEDFRVDESRLTDEARLVEDLDLDELDLIEFEMAIEEKFGIEISGSDTETIVTVADAIALVVGRLEGERRR